MTVELASAIEDKLCRAFEDSLLNGDDKKETDLLQTAVEAVMDLRKYLEEKEPE